MLGPSPTPTPSGSPQTPPGPSQPLLPATPKPNWLQRVWLFCLYPLGWGEYFYGDPNRGWGRFFDSIGFWVPWFFRHIGGATFYVVLLLFVQTYLNVSKFNELVSWDPVEPFFTAHTTLKLFAPWIASAAVGIVLLFPILVKTFKEGQDKTEHHQIIQNHLIPFLSQSMRGLAAELMDASGPACQGNVRVNVTIVRRNWFNRYLEHLASSQGETSDREVKFLLNEGLPGWAYSRPGKLRIELYDVAKHKVRPSTLDKLSTSNKVIACRAIGLDYREVKRKRFNRVLGVLIITSDDLTDEQRFRTPIFGEIIDTAAGGVGKLLADIRRGYDGY